MLHHVHAADVAQRIVCAIEQRTASVGEVFNTVSAHALTLRGYAEAMFRWFGQEPRLVYMPFEEWQRTLCESEAKISRLGYSPRYTSLEDIQESVQALIASGRITKV